MNRIDPDIEVLENNIKIRWVIINTENDVIVNTYESREDAENEIVGLEKNSFRIKKCLIEIKPNNSKGDL